MKLVKYVCLKLNIGKDDITKYMDSETPTYITFCLFLIQLVQLYGKDYPLSQVGPYWVTVLDGLTLLNPEEAGSCAMACILPFLNPGWLSSKVV